MNLKKVQGGSISSYEHETVLQNIEPVRKVLLHSNLLLQVIESVKDEYLNNDFKKAHQDFKDGIFGKDNYKVYHDMFIFSF